MRGTERGGIGNKGRRTTRRVRGQLLVDILESKNAIMELQWSVE